MSRNAHASNDVDIAGMAWWPVSNCQAVFYRLEPGAKGYTSVCDSETAVRCSWRSALQEIVIGGANSYSTAPNSQDAPTLDLAANVR